MANTVKRVKETIKVGYLPLYIKLYDDSNPHALHYTLSFIYPRNAQ